MIHFIFRNAELILSLRKQLVFIDVPKTGSTTVESLLSHLCDIQASEKQKFYHMDIKTLAGVFTERSWQWDKFFKFTVVRHPIDRLYSFHKYRLRIADETRINKPKRRQDFISRCIEYKANCGGTFVEADRSFNRAESNGLLNVRSQSSFVFDEAHGLAVDKVLHLENLAFGLQELFEKLNLDQTLLNPIPTLNQSHSAFDGSPAQLLCESNKRRIYQRYADDFKKFNYK